MNCSYPDVFKLVYKDGTTVEPLKIKVFKVDGNVVIIYFKSALRRIVPLGDIKEIEFLGGTIT